MTYASLGPHPRKGKTVLFTLDARPVRMLLTEEPRTSAVDGPTVRPDEAQYLLLTGWELAADGRRLRLRCGLLVPRAGIAIVQPDGPP